MTAAEPAIRDLLRLTLTPGMGPVLIARLLEAFGSPERILAASAKELERVKGIGDGRSTAFVRGMKEAASQVEPELELAAKVGARLIAKSDPEYPQLLHTINDPPPLLYIRGSLEPGTADQYPVAIDCRVDGSLNG